MNKQSGAEEETLKGLIDGLGLNPAFILHSPSLGLSLSLGRRDGISSLVQLGISSHCFTLNLE